MILPERQDTSNDSENSRYNLAACVMLIMILTTQKERIARNDLEKIVRLSEEAENPLLPLMENAL
mgnify:FL=1